MSAPRLRPRRTVLGGAAVRRDGRGRAPVSQRNPRHHIHDQKLRREHHRRRGGDIHMQKEVNTVKRVRAHFRFDVFATLFLFAQRRQ